MNCVKECGTTHRIGTSRMVASKYTPLTDIKDFVMHPAVEQYAPQAAAKVLAFAPIFALIAVLLGKAAKR